MAPETPRDGRYKAGPDLAHPYIHRKLGSPCPGIATMINHSYLQPKDDNDQISIFALIVAMRECYHLSWFFSIIFAIVGTLRLGKVFGFNIIELGRHGRFEHDASITRFDVSKGNALDPDLGLIRKFFDSSAHPIPHRRGENSSPERLFVTLEDYAKKRVELESKVTRYPLFQPKWVVSFAGTAEACLSLQVFRASSKTLSEIGADKAAPIASAEWQRVWYSEERLPTELGWHKPSRSIGLLSTLNMVRKMHNIQKRMTP